MTSDAAEPHPGGGSREFLTTQWSLVIDAGDTESPRAAGALESLCAIYWSPLYAYLRRQQWSPEDAADLTQAFFARLLEGRRLSQADRERGRFRTFLITALKHFVSDERDRVRAWKRGGRVQHVPLDPVAGEEQFERSLAVPGPDDRFYDRTWAYALLERVRGRLISEAAASGRGSLAEALLPRSGVEAPAYREIGDRLGLTEGAVKLAAFRLRQRYREIIREEVSQTVADPSELEDEIRHLLDVVAGGGGS